MTNIYSYFGIQDVHDLANRVLIGDPSDLGDRAAMCTNTAQTVQTEADQLQTLSEEMFRSWTGQGAAAAEAKMTAVVEARRKQADQLTRSAAAFIAVDNALVSAQSTARQVVALAEAAGRALDIALRSVQLAMDALTGGGLVNWAVEKTTGVDLEAEGRKLLLAAVRPIYEEALGLLDRMEAAIRAYEEVLSAQAEVLRAMPGIVRTDAGPIDLPGDADLRRGALFESVYGRPPVTQTDLMMADALDMQGSDGANQDPNARIVVTHITPVPGAGVVHGSAFIGDDEVFDPRMGSLNDKGDNRGFDPNAAPDRSRVSFYVDYETGVVVVRQNASHDSGGDALVGDPSVGVEQDPQGRVRLRVDATNPLAPQVGQDLKVSVRGDLVIDPHGGTGPATVGGAVTRFPSWETYQTQGGGSGAVVMQRPENALPLGMGPFVGLPQGTLPVGTDGSALADWRKNYHPGQGDLPGIDLPRNLPEVFRDDFYQYGLPNAQYPSIDGQGRLSVPAAGRVG